MSFKGIAGDVTLCVFGQGFSYGDSSDKRISDLKNSGSNLNLNESVFPIYVGGAGGGAPVWATRPYKNV